MRRRSACRVVVIAPLLVKTIRRWGFLIDKRVRCRARSPGWPRSMQRLFIALGATLMLSVPAALAQNAPPPACVVIGTSPLTQNEADVTISCSGMPDGMAGPLTAVLTRILQQRL